MAIAIALVLIAIVSFLFHFLSPWWFTPLASNWHQMDVTLIITLWISGIVFIAITFFIAYAVIRFRHQEGKRAAYEPENRRLEWWLLGLTSVGIVIMLVPGLFVWAEFINVPKDALTFEVVGQQWQWSFRFPGKDGVLGRVDTRLISVENPFGLHTGNPFGQDDVLVQSNEVHLPLGRPVKVLLRSKDVLHDFYVPYFRVKMDAVPSLVSGAWFIPTKAGTFEIACAEYCGLGHYVMRPQAAGCSGPPPRPSREPRVRAERTQGIDWSNKAGNWRKIRDVSAATAWTAVPALLPPGKAYTAKPKRWPTAVRSWSTRII